MIKRITVDTNIIFSGFARLGTAKALRRGVARRYWFLCDLRGSAVKNPQPQP